MWYSLSSCDTEGFARLQKRYFLSLHPEPLPIVLIQGLQQQCTVASFALSSVSPFVVRSGLVQVFKLSTGPPRQTPENRSTLETYWYRPLIINTVSAAHVGSPDSQNEFEQLLKIQLKSRGYGLVIHWSSPCQTTCIRLSASHCSYR